MGRAILSRNAVTTMAILGLTEVLLNGLMYLVVYVVFLEVRFIYLVLLVSIVLFFIAWYNLCTTCLAKTGNNYKGMLQKLKGSLGTHLTNLFMSQ